MPEPWTTSMVPFASAPAVPYPSAAGVPAFPAPGYPSAGAVPAYPGAVAEFSTPGWSGYAADLEKPKNSLATWALTAGIVVIVVLLFLNFALASALAILLGVKAIGKARAIKAAGYPTAVGMGRAVTGLVLSCIGGLVFLVSMLGS